MKLKITQPGVFAPAEKGSKGEREVPVGTIIDIDGDKVPAALVGKCEVMGNEAAGKTPVTNPAKDEAKTTDNSAGKKAD